MTDDNKTPDDLDAAPADAASGSDATDATDAGAESIDDVVVDSEAVETDVDVDPSRADAVKVDADGSHDVIAAATPEERARARRSASPGGGSGESRPVRAVAKYLRFSAQKGRLVVDQIRGKRVIDAATALAFSDRDAAREVIKVLKSAVSNAENNHGMSVQDLYVSAAFVNEGPTFKRFKPRARGRTDRINKRTCHVTVVVDNAPASLLEGRGGAKKASGDRSARVAASKSPQTQGPVKKDGGTTRKPKAKSSAKSTAAAPAATTKGDS